MRCSAWRWGGSRDDGPATSPSSRPRPLELGRELGREVDGLAGAGRRTVVLPERTPPLPERPGRAVDGRVDGREVCGPRIELCGRFTGGETFGGWRVAPSREGAVDRPGRRESSRPEPPELVELLGLLVTVGRRFVVLGRLPDVVAGRRDNEPLDSVPRDGLVAGRRETDPLDSVPRAGLLVAGRRERVPRDSVPRDGLVAGRRSILTPSLVVVLVLPRPTLDPA